VSAGPTVLQVLQPPDGGVAEHVLMLCTGLVQRGFEVEAAIPPDSTIGAALAESGTLVHELPLVRRPGAHDLVAARTLRTLDARRGYALVHAHSSKAGALARAVLPRRRRLIYTPHCFAFAAVGFGAPRRLLYRAVEQALVPRSGAIVAVCEWERDLGRRRLAGAAGLLRTIENGVPACERAQPDRELLEFKGSQPLAGSICVLRPQKDPLLAVRAAARLRRPGKLAIVGEGALRDAVVGEIERLGLGERVRWFPYRGRMGPYLAALDVFLLSSAWEALPLSVLEAMSCALPVVSTRVGGVPEAVHEGHSGLRRGTRGRWRVRSTRCSRARRCADRWAAPGASCSSAASSSSGCSTRRPPSTASCSPGGAREPGYRSAVRFSVVIATKGRPDALRETLRSLGRCEPEPDELIVVDGDPEGSAGAPVRELDQCHDGPPARYVASEPGLTRQRNLGTSAATGDVIVFLDDDVEVSPGLFAALARAYRERDVVGATGFVVERSGRRLGDKASRLRRLLLGRRGEGTMTRFGYPRRLPESSAERDVEFMQGCLMSARRELVERVRFDERLTGYGLAEDEDFSYRLSRLGRIRYLPDATVVHKNTGFRTADQRSFNRTVVVNRAYLFRKNFERTPLARAQFAIFVLFLLAHRALNREWRGIVGIGEGALQAWKERR
jgi:glycosyltransferase involved in cell wall biosynthesis/GT2 family glycosyltransferase